MDCQLLKEIIIEEAQSPVSEGVLKKYIDESNGSTVQSNSRSQRQKVRQPWARLLRRHGALWWEQGVNRPRDLLGQRSHVRRGENSE